MLDPLYWLAANAIVFFHRGFGPIFGHDSFFGWALSVVLLVVVVRILIFPLFVKQVKSQRKMQMMQPLIKEIKEKWGHDKQRMQQEMVNLQREHGNPLLGCLPILLQIPLFIALFHVFNSLKPVQRAEGLTWVSRVDLPAETVRQIAEAKLLGISLSTSFTSGDDLLSFIGANGTNVKIAAVVLILLMGATTFLTQRQIMARTGPVDPQQALIQKVLLYGSPIMLAVFGFQFPIAVLLYWLTTNLWSMGQQFFVIKKMPPLQPAGAGAAGREGGGRPPADPAVEVSRPRPGVKPQRGQKRTAAGAGSASGKASQAGASTGGASTGGAKAGGAKAGGAKAALAKSGAAGNAAAGAARRGAGSAPPGTSSPRGAARNGKSANAQVPAAADEVPADKVKLAKVPADQVPKAEAAKAKAATQAADAALPGGKGTAAAPKGAKPPRGAGSASTGAAGTNADEASPGGADARSRASKNGSAAEPAQRSSSPPVGAGARRQPAGARPAKRRSKNKRPGGRR